MALTAGADLQATDGTHAEDISFLAVIASTGLTAVTHRACAVNATAATVNLTLPAASASNNVTFYIQRVVTESNSINIVPNGADLINGVNASISLVSLFQFTEIRSNGTAWFIINESSGLTTLNVVNVFEAADIPATPVADTNYVLHAPVTLTTPLTVPNTGILEFSSTNIAANKITYSGTGAFLIGTGVIGIRINCQIDSSSTGTLFGMTGNAAPNSFVFNGNGGFDGWDDLGTLTSFGALVQENVIMSNFGAGIKLVSTAGYFSQLTNWFNLSDSGTDFLTFDSSVEQISVTNGGYTPFANERIFNINSSATVFAFISLMQNVSASDRYFNSAGLVSTDPGIICEHCAELEDSGTSAELTLTGNSLATDIPLAGALVEIGSSVSWVSSEVERLNVNSDGSVESLGLRPAKIKIDANINLSPASSSKSISIKTVLVSPPPVTVTFTNATNLINDTATTLSDDDLVSFRDTVGTLPAQLRIDIVYHVVNKLTNSFQVSYTEGGAVVTFSDDGTPVNSYQVATLHGSTPANIIASGSPRDLIPQATVPARLNSESFLVVMNNDDAVDITVNSGYQRYFV